MSWWTYVDGVMTVKTLAESPEQALLVVKRCLASGPGKIITGSERDAWFTTCIPPRQDVDEDEPGQDYYDIVVTVHGSLRDRLFDQTLRETVRLLKCLGRRLWVGHCLIAVNGYKDGEERTAFIRDPRWVSDLEQDGWNERALKDVTRPEPESTP